MAYNQPQELTFLQSITASSSATISFTSKIDSDFDTFVVKFRNIFPATNAALFRMLFSTNNGSSYLASTGYRWAMINSTSTGLTQDGATATSSFQVANGLSTTSGRVMNGTMILYGLNSAANTKSFYSSVEKIGSSGDLEEQRVGGVHTGTTAVNAIRFQMSSGNIASGTFILYGVKEP